MLGNIESRRRRGRQRMRGLEGITDSRGQESERILGGGEGQGSLGGAVHGVAKSRPLLSV